jgi:hypothetical protein
MAVTKQDVLSFIAQHSTSDRPNVPAKEIIAVLGTEARGIIDDLKKAGTVAQDDVAAQFAALMEKLEADSASSEAVAV